MGTFTTRSNIKVLTGIPTGVTMYDAAIDIVVEMVDDIILNEIGLTSASVTTYNESYDVTYNGQTEISLDRIPVVSVAAVTIAPVGGTGGNLLQTKNYYFTEWGALRLKPLYALLPTGRQVVQVCYTAGFSSIPNDLKYAASLIAVQAFNQQSHLGYKSERTGGYSYSMNPNGDIIPKLAARILNKHRRLFARP